ncbi:MAG: NUDIX hydrolase [Thermomicrobiales bacterium]|nr:NUDIX hydrolase [Thermomicrobiales bacterium]
MTDFRMIVNVEVAIVNASGHYLMIVRSDDEPYMPGVLSMPGGKVDPVVTVDALEDTAIREVLEEVGLRIERPQYVESHTFYADDALVLDVVMLARHQGDEPQIVAADEVAGLRWMTLAEIESDTDIPSWTRNSILRAEAVRQILGW